MNIRSARTGVANRRGVFNGGCSDGSLVVEMLIQ